MDWVKLLAATIITLIIGIGIVVFLRLLEKTDGLIMLVFLFVFIVLIVYANL